MAATATTAAFAGHDEASEVLQANLRRYRRALAEAPSDRAILRIAPALSDIVDHRRLADSLPTPVSEIEIGDSRILVKRDDLTSSLYGGNKVRKLEWLLAGPAAASEVLVTGGGTASHHVLATALFGRLLDLDTEAVLFAQPPNPGIEVLTRVLDATRTPAHETSSMFLYPVKLLEVAARVLARGRRPRILYPGGSTGAGTLGYVDCALEIAGAVDRGEIDEPAVVFCALGSAGTAVGLAIGFEIAGLSTRVAGVRVTDAIVNGPPVLHAMDGACRGLLRIAGCRVPSAVWRIEIVDGYLGDGYGYPTLEGSAAVEIAGQLGLPAEQTYTGKALAAALDRAGQEIEGPVMFLETLSKADPLDALTARS